MSYQTKLDLRDAFRRNARRFGAPDCAALEGMADRLDSNSMTSTGATYFCDAERLRILAEQLAERERAARANVMAAIRDSEQWEQAYERLQKNLDAANAEITAKANRITAKANRITTQARELATLTDKYTAEVRRSTPLARVLADTIAELADDEDIEIQFVYGYNNGGVEPGDAMDLRQALRKAASAGDVLSKARS